jgi:hypothetical protein
MKTILLILIVASVFCSGCNRTKKVSDLYEQALHSFNQKEFNRSKLLIDSILSTYPDNVEFTVRSKDLLATITLSEQEANLKFLDSLLVVKEKELEPLMKNFEENNEVGDVPVLIHKRQKVDNSFNRTFISAYLNKDGEFYLSSRYVGSKRIYHNQIRIYHQDISVLSEPVAEDSIANRSFNDDGVFWEVVNYKNNRDNGIADVVSEHYKLPLKAEFIGRERYYIVLEQFDKEAIRDAYEISFLLREVKKIKEQRDNVEKTIKKIK